MSIAISLKVNEGVILAADSAATVTGIAPTGEVGVANIYNNANKIINLRKEFSIGVVAYGSASIGVVPISSIFKDLRNRFQDPDDLWHLDKGTYTMKYVADRVKEYIYDGLYVAQYKDWPEKPTMGFIIAGYSPREQMAEEFSFEITKDGCVGPKPIRAVNQIGVTWRAEGEAIHRLVLGYDPRLKVVLEQGLGVPPNQLDQAMQVIRSGLTAQLISEAMPIQDAIDLAEFLVDLTVKYYRFRPSAPTVGGPIEIAAITKHEGFKWVKRKHYYSRELNPEPPNLNEP